MLTFRTQSGIFLLEAQQDLPLSIEEAWQFFSSPGNLQKITPNSMGFEITSQTSDKMYAGQIITYKVSPFPGWKTNWVTEITQVRHQEFFIDEQRFGPYTMWHHEHHFESIDGGVRMRDLIYYKPPMGFIGRIFEPILVRPQLRKIFEFRKTTLESTFGTLN